MPNNSDTKDDLEPDLAVKSPCNESVEYVSELIESLRGKDDEDAIDNNIDGNGDDPESLPEDDRSDDVRALTIVADSEDGDFSDSGDEDALEQEETSDRATSDSAAPNNRSTTPNRPSDADDFSSETGYAYRRSMLHNLRAATRIATSRSIDLDDCSNYACRSYFCAIFGVASTVFSIIFVMMSPQPGSFGFVASVVSFTAAIAFGFGYLFHFRLLNRKLNFLRERRGESSNLSSNRSLATD